MHRVMAIVLLLAGLATGSCWGSGSEPNRPAVRAAPDPNTLDGVLQTLQDKAAALKSYQVNVDYIFKQPLLESQQRRKGVLYYAKFDDKSYLRIDFRYGPGGKGGAGRPAGPGLSFR